MNTYKIHRLSLPIGLLLSVSLPLQANPQTPPGQAVFMPILPTVQPIYVPQPMPSAQSQQSPVFTAPEYVDSPAKTTTPVVGDIPKVSTVVDTKQAANAVPSVPEPVIQTAPQQSQAKIPPIGAYGYVDDPATSYTTPAPAYSAPARPIPNQTDTLPAVDNYGYAPNPYYAQAYPSAGYGYPQWAPNQNNNPFDNLGSEFFSGQNPFTNPMNTDGYWAKPDFRPWSSGPLAPNRWGNHPMNNMPWGTFPGWGDGFFGGFGPDNWKGITPWGNNVPFRWIDPTEPRESIATIWDDAINTPNNMGRMPPGWTAPYISVPNPVDVADEFEKNARRFPDEINNMIDFGDDD